ncbi:MAG: alpha/beta fold hydrolase [Leptospira sp.]|nr:alpha/beta fold hydrolase [Leptospira sp.]
MKNLILLVLGFSLSCGSIKTTDQFMRDDAQKIGNTKTIVLIHGMYLTPKSWQPFKEYFEKKGYKVHAPAWPLHDRDPKVMREAHPEEALAQLTLDEVVEHYRTYLSSLKEKPILVGHSMGGLISQILLSENRASAAIAISSAPTKGLISLKYSFLKSNWGAISPFASLDEPIFLNLEQFQYGFVNGLEESFQKNAYEMYSVPESRKVGKGPTTDIASINFKERKMPLYFIAGENDRTIPASLNYSNFQKYEDAKAITSFRLFPKRNHFIVGAPGWEEIADSIDNWIKENR